MVNKKDGQEKKDKEKFQLQRNSKEKPEKQVSSTTISLTRVGLTGGTMLQHLQQHCTLHLRCCLFHSRGGAVLQIQTNQITFQQCYKKYVSRKMVNESGS